MEGLLKRMIMIVIVAVIVVIFDWILIMSGALFAWRSELLCRLSRGGSDRLDALCDIAVDHGNFIFPPLRSFHSPSYSHLLNLNSLIFSAHLIKLNQNINHIP